MRAISALVVVAPSGGRPQPPLPPPSEICAQEAGLFGGRRGMRSEKGLDDNKEGPRIVRLLSLNQRPLLTFDFCLSTSTRLDDAHTRSCLALRRSASGWGQVTRIASWVLGTSVPLKKGPSARGLQTVPHSKTGTRALLGPCAPAFRRCALRWRRRSRRRCCSAACTRSALVRS